MPEILKNFPSFKEACLGYSRISPYKEIMTEIFKNFLTICKNA
jgi:hypothetical protein